MKLIVAEKPSVAQSIAAAVGSTEKRNGYIEGNDYIVSWCIGHLVIPQMPEDFNADLKDWKIETLPILPSPLEMKLSPKTRTQYLILKELMHKPEVDSIVCATDAAREGELIFRLVYLQAKCKKPFERLWVSSMEESAILNALQNMKPGHEYDNLYHAARCRQMADWYVGINLTRLYSCLYSSRITVGRVQTPTVNLIVERQRTIDTFKPIPYYILSADFGGFCGALRFDDIQHAELAKKACEGKQGAVTSVVKNDIQKNPPELYDLTSLQRDANRTLGYTAQQTLDYMQSLYDKKLATYPRTESRYLTADMESSTTAVITQMVTQNIVQGLQSYALNKISIERVINNKKVSDHHAILPTQQITSDVVSNLPTGEKSILELIVYRLLTAVYLPYLYADTKVVISIGEYEFSATAKEVQQLGWKAVDRATPENAENDAPHSEKGFPPLEVGIKMQPLVLSIEQKHTKPPLVYTEDTLLQAMASAGKDLDDKTLRDAIKRGGLGTPATRAEVIEKIIRGGYIERAGKKLIPTEKAYTFVDLMHEKIKSAELTAYWESEFAQIAIGARSADSFVQEIQEFVMDLVTNLASGSIHANKNVFQSEQLSVGQCPICGKDVLEYPKSFSCASGKDGCGFVIWKTICEKRISTLQASKLLSQKTTGLIKGFKSKRGNTFSAYLTLDSSGKTSMQFPEKKTK